MEIVGELLGIDTEREVSIRLLQAPPCRVVVPSLAGSLHRTTFARQVANLWVAKERLWRGLLGRIEFDPRICSVDSFPVPVCLPVRQRAYRCRLLPEEESAFGHDEMSKSRPSSTA
jgi:hypothetical protein